MKFHGSGHVYFSLKDEKSRINCFLPSDRAVQIGRALQEGMEIIASGYIYLYERGGSYSLNVTDLEKAGQGELAIAFEKLKQKLAKEGLFDQEHKKLIPAFPHKVAIVTSETGAGRSGYFENHTEEKQLRGCAGVPGPGTRSGSAAADRGCDPGSSGKLSGCRYDHHGQRRWIHGRTLGFQRRNRSPEHLRIEDPCYICRRPDETDFTIADFVADLRAETPTAAADLAVPDTGGFIHEDLEFYRKEMMRSLELLVEKKKRRMALCSMENFERDIRGRIAMEQMRIDHMAEQMKQQLLAKEENCRSRLELLRETVEAADPNRILQKGYTILRDEEGNVILDVAALRKDQDVSLEGAGGFAEAKVVSARKKAGKKAEKR